MRRGGLRASEATGLRAKAPRRACPQHPPSILCLPSPQRLSASKEQRRAHWDAVLACPASPTGVAHQPTCPRAAISSAVSTRPHSAALMGCLQSGSGQGTGKARSATLPEMYSRRQGRQKAWLQAAAGAAGPAGGRAGDAGEGHGPVAASNMLWQTQHARACTHSQVLHTHTPKLCIISGTSSKQMEHGCCSDCACCGSCCRWAGCFACAAESGVAACCRPVRCGDSRSRDSIGWASLLRCRCSCPSY